jgi:hypothetical protein
MQIKLACLIIGPLLITGCASTDVDDATRDAMATVLVTTLALAADDDASDKHREYQPGEWAYCDIGCQFQRQTTRDRQRDAARARERHQEIEQLQSEFETFMKEPETDLPVPDPAP